MSDDGAHEILKTVFQLADSSEEGKSFVLTNFRRINFHTIRSELEGKKSLLL